MRSLTAALPRAMISVIVANNIVAGDRRLGAQAIIVTYQVIYYCGIIKDLTNAQAHDIATVDCIVVKLYVFQGGTTAIQLNTPVVVSDVTISDDVSFVALFSSSASS